MPENKGLTPNFSFEELTQTSYPQFQEKNRVVNDYQLAKLRLVAQLLEVCRRILNVPLTAHSGYRCPELNTFIGSKPSSQHPKCEAADFVPEGLDLDKAFALLIEAAKAGNLKFGQLIIETANRNYGVARWIHISIGFPYRDREKCGEIMAMKNGVYEELDRIA